MTDTVFRMAETSADLSPHRQTPLGQPAASLSSAAGALIGPFLTGVGPIKKATAANRLLRRAVRHLMARRPAAISESVKADGAQPAAETPAALQLSPKQERAWVEIKRLRKFFVIVLDQKGGIGKSVMVQIAYETISIGEKGAKNKVLVLDADFINKNLSRVGLSGADDAVRADKKDLEGVLFEAAEQMELGLVHGVVVDSAAGSEHHFHQHLAPLAEHLKSFGARLIVIRPITTNPLNQDNCIDFGRSKAMTGDMGVVMVRNFGQGREPDDYTIWMESDERREMLAAGMVECDLESAGALCSDLAAACGVSIADIARKTIAGLGLTGRKHEIATKYFTRRFQLFVARWMARQTITFESAFAEAIRRTFLP
ncbi:hypothetical protein [Lichenibacterium dinghuense]|uniref:hypothetical protein n=1 Tax=Lichenibacterium dinghuense TaxID=2895977 RepID=UPI001F235BCA|nr:hypothetical protein [Lichenibacterium sp. 6Y81]